MKRNPRIAPAPEPDRPVEPAPPRVPATALDIPGLGPIRVRALQKAGLGDLAGLRKATLEQLTAVPGMSEIKARQVTNYLSDFPVEALDAADRRRTAAPPRDAYAAGALFADERVAHARQSARSQPSEFAQVGLQVLELTLGLLLTDTAAGYRGRLMRELARLLNRSYAVLLLGAVSDRTGERALKSLHSAVEALTTTRRHPALERKAQLRLAETLGDVGDALDALLGTVSTSSTAEETDD